MDSKQMQDAGDSSDSDVLDNWTILDTEEAIEATSLDTKQDEVENEESESLLAGAESEKTADVLKDNCVQFITDNNQTKTEEQFLEAEGDAASDTDDGVSIITDSEPEELVLPPAPPRRFSDHSNDYFDSSDNSVLHELPVDLGHKAARKYVHTPNRKINFVLNGVLVICLASVFGLGVGHFLGIQEECGVPVEGHFSPLDTQALLKRLEVENDALKLQLKQLQQDIQMESRQHIQVESHLSPHHMDESGLVLAVSGEGGGEVAAQQEAHAVHLQPLWSVNGGIADPDHPTEPADVAGEDSHTLTENLSKEAVSEITSEASPDVPSREHKQEEIQYPYNDEDLELIQTRYVEQNEARRKQKESRRQEKNKPDTFFTKMEAELNGIMNRVVDYSSNLVKSNNLKEHVATSMGVLSTTLQDMQDKVKSLGDITAQHSIHAVDKVKKSVFKMVQNVRRTSDNLMKADPEKKGISSKLMKGVYQLKDGLLDKWCHLKGKMARGLGAQGDDVIRKCRQQYKEQTPRQGEDKTQLHPSKSFKSEGKTPGYVEKRQFDVKLKNSSHHTESKHKRYNVKSKHGKKQHKDPLLLKQEQGEKAWKEKCSRDENCNVTDGQWMERMAKGREEQRHADRESDWQFERAKARRQSRQHDQREDNWYLKRGKSRQHNRKDYIVHQGYGSPWVDTRKL